MAGSFGGINTLSQALRAFQRGLDVTGHNISNANTVGYTRQLVNYAANPADLYYSPNGAFQVGTGVSVQDVARVRDFLTDRSMWDANGDMGRFHALASSLSAIEGAFPEPGEAGISAALSKFFDAWSGLASNPNDPAAKLAVQQAGLTLTGRVRQTFSSLSGQAAGVISSLNGAFDRVDQLTAKIAELNDEIVAKVATGASPNDLMDQRDLAVEELSGLIDVQAHIYEDGSMAVYSGQISLVNGTASFAIPRNFNQADGTLGGFPLGGGEIAGLIQAANKAQSYLDQLDTFANNLKSEINALHETGVGPGGTTGVLFFADADPQTGAADFDLSAAVKADSGAIMSGTSGAAGDGSLALALSRMREASLTGLGGKSFKDFYGGLVATVGSDSAYYTGQIDTQASIIASIENRRQAISGVNLDDEMTNMLRYQRSYQAAAKALQVMDEVTADIIGLIR